MTTHTEPSPEALTGRLFLFVIAGTVVVLTAVGLLMRWG
jgi:hypothetical protein